MREIDAGGPIAWRSLHEAVTARLRDLIVAGELPEGSRIVERELCDQLGVSRTPLREAFKVLAVEGLVEILPNRGAVVSRLGPPRRATCCASSRGSRRSPASWPAPTRPTRRSPAIRALHDEMIELYRTSERSEYFRLNQDIHLAIVRIARNEALRAMHALLHARMKRIRFRGNDIPENWAAAVADHDAHHGGAGARATARRSARSCSATSTIPGCALRRACGSTPPP